MCFKSTYFNQNKGSFQIEPYKVSKFCRLVLFLHRGSDKQPVFIAVGQTSDFFPLLNWQMIPSVGLCCPTLLTWKWDKKWRKVCCSTITCLTLTVHSPTKSNKGKWRKCAKSDYVIEAGLIWEWNHCPGSDTRVACHGWTVHCGAGGPRFGTQGEPPFFDPSLSEEIV